MVEDNFSIAFMFSAIYLKLEGKVPPPPHEWKVGIRVRVTFYFSGHSDIVGWQGTPHPQEWKVQIRVRATFYFSGHSDIGGWQGTPSPEIEIGLNMNAMEKNHFN